MFEYLPIGTDVLVLIVGVLLYLTDLGCLLYANEVVFVGRAESNWAALTPADGIRFSRRSAVLPRLYDPGSVVIRMLWLAKGSEERQVRPDLRESIEQKLRSLLVPRVMCTLLLPQIFLGIPIAYMQANYAWPTFWVIVLIYLQVLVLIVWLLMSRTALQVPWKMTLLLAFESLVCIPYAINFHRKLAARVASMSATNPADVARSLLPEDRLRRLLAQAESARIGRQ